MRETIEIHVHHPIREGRIALRLQTDWDHDVHPVHVDHEAGRHEFRIETDQLFLYFKPVHYWGDEAEPRWADGPDRVATAAANRVWDVFPAFDDDPAALGDPETVEWHDHRYTIRMFLPRGYAENTLHRYPVVYMNDGHNLFYRQESAVGVEWSVQDTLHKLHEMNTIEPVLVVGVYPNQRMHDYGDAGIDAFTKCMAEGIRPYVDARYRTLPDPEHRAVVGSSLGGVAAMETAWRFPHYFGKVAALSASFGYQDELARRVLTDPKPDLQIYLDSGWPRDNFEVTRDLHARLVRAGFGEGTDLMYFAFPDGRHNERDWGDRLHLPLQFFFGLDVERRTHAGTHAVER